MEILHNEEKKKKEKYRYTLSKKNEEQTVLLENGAAVEDSLLNLIDNGQNLDDFTIYDNFRNEVKNIVFRREIILN